MRAILIVMLSSLLGCVGYKEISNADKGASNLTEMSFNINKNIKGARWDLVMKYTTDIPNIGVRAYKMIGIDGLKSLINYIASTESQMIGNDYTQLIVHLIIEASIEDLDWLIEQGGTTNADYNDKDTLLSYVVKTGDYDRVKWLLDNKADPNRTARFGVPCLVEAVSNDDLKMAQLLIQYQANAKVRLDGPLHNTLTHVACSKANVEMLRILLEAGAEVNHPNYLKYTPVVVAAMNNKAKCVALLKKRGADIDIIMDDQPLVHIAAKEGAIDVVRFLNLMDNKVLHKRINNKKHPLYWYTPFKMAAKFKQYHTLSEYLKIDVLTTFELPHIYEIIKQDENVSLEEQEAIKEELELLNR